MISIDYDDRLRSSQNKSYPITRPVSGQVMKSPQRNQAIVSQRFNHLSIDLCSISVSSVAQNHSASGSVAP
jgi:hypothetical protein